MARTRTHTPSTRLLLCIKGRTLILLCRQTHLEITTNARHVKLLMGGSPSETIMISSSCAGPTDSYGHNNRAMN